LQERFKLDRRKEDLIHRLTGREARLRSLLQRAAPLRALEASRLRKRTYNSVHGKHGSALDIEAEAIVRDPASGIERDVGWSMRTNRTAYFSTHAVRVATFQGVLRCRAPRRHCEASKPKKNRQSCVEGMLDSGPDIEAGTAARYPAAGIARFASWSTRTIGIS